MSDGGAVIVAALAFLDRLAVCHADEFPDAQRYLDVRLAAGDGNP
jgi:hypothetical protein